MLERREDPFEGLQQTNGEDHRPPPQGNTNPQLRSVLPSTSPLEFKGNFTQARSLGGIRDLPAGIYQGTGNLGWIILGALEAPGPLKARDLELAGEIALFREIMKDWDFDDRQASALLGYVDSTFATDLFKGLATIRQRDAEGRLLAVVSMAADLDALYRDVDVIRKWLRNSQDLLDGKTPFETTHRRLERRPNSRKRVRRISFGSVSRARGARAR
jgi:hypothetical protein